MECCISDEEFTALPAHKKWCRYFQKSKNAECHSELLRVAQFFFAIAPHNANVERVFSLMQSQWAKDRNKMTVETMKGILTLQYNFKSMSCGEFCVFLKSNKTLLKKIRSSEKYNWYEEKWSIVYTFITCNYLGAYFVKNSMLIFVFINVTV